MAYHPLGKEYEVYEMHPANCVEIIIAPAGKGNLDNILGVQEILDNGYRLICHDNATKKTEVSPITDTDRKNFFAGYHDGAIFKWVSLRGNISVQGEKIGERKISKAEPIKVRHLKVVA
jgi:hypothetical protein